MRTFSILVLVVIVGACSSLKQSQQALNSGNYDESIRIVVEKLSKNKDRRGNEGYITILQDAFHKATARDTDRIAFLRKESSKSNIQEIYRLYKELSARQEKIKPLLPLHGAHFEFRDYSTELIETKKELVNYLYDEAALLFERNNKMSYREAHAYYQDIERLIPNFKDVRAKMEKAHLLGLDFVLVNIVNETEQVIPLRLEEDLLNFNAYGLNDFWTVFDAQEMEDTPYDFGLELVLKNIKITPEQMREREIIKEKLVKDGYTYVKDAEGKVIIDSLGNKIKKDRYITVNCKIYESEQYKSCHMLAQVNYIDYATATVINNFPIDSRYVFNHSYGSISGDKRALEEELLLMSRRSRIPFPSNEQMVFDAGMDLKAKFKTIISRNHFR